MDGTQSFLGSRLRTYERPSHESVQVLASESDPQVPESDSFLRATYADDRSTTSDDHQSLHVFGSPIKVFGYSTSQGTAFKTLYLYLYIPNTLSFEISKISKIKNDSVSLVQYPSAVISVSVSVSVLDRCCTRVHDLIRLQGSSTDL